MVYTGCWPAEPNENCPDGQVVDTVSQCKKALAQFGLRYFGTFTNNNRPAGCFRYKNNKSGRFNYNTDPASTSPNKGTAGICHPGIIALSI